MNNKFAVMMLVMLASVFCGCASMIGKSYYKATATAHYAGTTEGQLQAITKRNTSPVFELGESSIVFFPGYARSVVHYGVSLVKPTADIPFVSPPGTYHLYMHVSPGPGSLLILPLDTFRVSVDALQRTVIPTHVEIERGDGSCDYLLEKIELHAYGVGCYVALYYSDLDFNITGHTLIPGPVNVDGVVYAIPDIRFE
jgi:hypothetical protein